MRLTDIDAETDVVVATVPDVRLAEMAMQHQKLLQRAAEVAADTASARTAADLESRLAQIDADVASGGPRLNWVSKSFVHIAMNCRILSADIGHSSECHLQSDVIGSRQARCRIATVSKWWKHILEV